MSPFDPKIHHRRSIRLPGYDYTQAGAYFVTIVTWRRDCLFGEVVDGEMRLNEAGQIVQWEWINLSQRFKFIELGTFTVMPNHFHGIPIFHNVGATHTGITDAISGKIPLRNTMLEGSDGSPLPHGPKPLSLGAILAQFKSRVTKRLWKIPSLAGTPIWQRNYYEHIIRNDQEMDKIWRYIEGNPVLWNDDDENPNNIKL
jgi:putative transposase